MDLKNNTCLGELKPDKALLYSTSAGDRDIGNFNFLYNLICAHE